MKASAAAAAKKKAVHKKKKSATKAGRAQLALFPGDEKLRWLWCPKHQINERADVACKHKASRVVERTLRDNRRKILYQLEKVICGKRRCKCARGAPHGPYWYAYFTVRSRRKGAVEKLRSVYLGKERTGKVAAARLSRWMRRK